MRKYYAVYIMASDSGTLYVGVTGRLGCRASQHREGEPGSFAARYRIHKLVFYEYHTDVWQAITREKQLKRWRREKKVALIEERNPQWLDLAPMVR